MMKKILKWVSLLFAVGMAVFVVFFLYSINSDEYTQSPEPLEYKSEVKKQEAQTLWLNHLSNAKKKQYFFPVDEIYIKTDLDLKKSDLKDYKLVVDELDPYEIFCLSRELKRFKIKYFFKKVKNKNILIVFSKDLDRLNRLVKVLKNYQIDAKIIKR
jgi:hypothetical protein